MNRLSICTCLIVCLFLLSVCTKAATYNIPDEDVAGLIAAINSSNANPDADVINLAAGGTYTLTSIAGPDSFHGNTGLPIVHGPSEQVHASLTINGNGATIQRSSVAGTPLFRIFHALFADVVLDGVVIRNGYGQGSRCGGGGLYLNVSNVTILNSTITENFGFEGGGICNNNASNLKIENSTISHNRGPGGEILNHVARLSLSNTTVFDDQPDSYRSDSIVDQFSAPGSIIFKNSIVASPTGSDGIDCYAFSPISLGHNIFSDSTCGQNVQEGDQIIPDLHLGPLADNDGPTPTRALLTGGLGIDTVPLSDCTNVDGALITQDQRGVSRPRGNFCDTGAYEYDFDGTPPEISASVTGTLGNNDWYTSNVDVSWSVTDSESAVSSSSGCDVIVVTTDTNGTTLTCTATSSGGTATQSVTVKRDATAPSFNCGSPDGLWHASDVSIACTGTDPVSGVAAAGDASFSLSTSVAAGIETSNASTGSRSVCDNAGNCATAGPIAGNKVDKKAPQITLTTPTAGTYLVNQSVAANYSCADSGSGVAGCGGTAANGAAIDTATAGSKTFTVTATDNVGNTATPSTVNYTVAYGVQALYDQTRAHKSGSTIPIKIRLVDANGANVSTPSLLPHAISVIQVSSQASTEFGDAGNSNPDFNFRYDATLGGYIFNLQTTGMGTGSYMLNFIAGSPQPVYSVGFQIRR